MVAQSYDGAAVVASNLNGLQAKIREKYPEAIFIHCHAHRLNLVLSQSFSQMNECKTFFAVEDDFCTFFSRSPKRTVALDAIVKRRLPKSAATRWTYCSRQVNMIKDHREDLVVLFESIINHPVKWDSNTIFQAEIFYTKL